jgi:hypothetical protein
VLVVVIVVLGVPVAVVHEVDVVAVWHGYVAAALAVFMVVAGVRVVPASFAFVDVTVVLDVQVSVVGVVDVVTVRDRRVPAAGAVAVAGPVVAVGLAGVQEVSRP